MIKRGVQHRLKCPYSVRNAEQMNPCKDNTKWCLPCMFRLFKTLRQRAGIQTDIMFPALHGHGAMSQEDMGTLLRSVRHPAIACHVRGRSC